MTRNQIEYLKVKVTERTLDETIRHNKENEKVALLNYELGVRSQSEVERHNLIVEDQAYQSISVARMQAGASALAAQASMLGAQAAMTNAETNQSLLPYQQETETSKANLNRAQAELLSAQAAGQRITNTTLADVNKTNIDFSKAKQQESSAHASYYEKQTSNVDVQNALTERGQNLNFAGTVISGAERAMGSIIGSTINANARTSQLSGTDIANTVDLFGGTTSTSWNGSFYDSSNSNWSWGS